MNRGTLPMFSVVVPTHNRASTIGRAIRSALREGPDVEVIVVDDASSDETLEVLEAFESAQLRVHHMVRNSGAPAARNMGVRLARGKYVAFLDSDDVLLPGRLNRQRHAIERSSGVVASTGAFLAVGNGAPRHGFSTLGRNRQTRRILRLRHGSLTSSVLMAKRSAAISTPWDESLPALQDYDMLLRLSGKGRVSSLAQVLAMKERQESRVYSGRRVARGRSLIIRKHIESLRQDSVALRRHYAALLSSVRDEDWFLNAEDAETASVLQDAQEYMELCGTSRNRVTDSLKFERVIGRAADSLCRIRGRQRLLP